MQTDFSQMSNIADMNSSSSSSDTSFMERDFEHEHMNSSRSSNSSNLSNSDMSSNYSSEEDISFDGQILPYM